MAHVRRARRPATRRRTRRRTRRVRRALAVALFAVPVALAGCGDAPETIDRRAAIYAAVVRAAVPPEPPEDDHVAREVFVGTPSDVSISLELQAAMLAALDEYDTVRFVDEPSEAIDEDAAGHVVRNGGVYLELGRVPDAGTVVRIRVLRYVDVDDESTLTLRLERSGGEWRVTDP